ncbi:MAG: hypothetical protein NTV86_24010 [Planctomycetota bacterium]|nr:hypothetical protein [Planctomycetota bacterium]
MDTSIRRVVFVIALLATPAVCVAQAMPVEEVSGVLGRPTDTSVTVSVLSADAREGYIEYGPAAGEYTKKTGVVKFPAGTPVEIPITGLERNRRQFYRLEHRRAGRSLILTRCPPRRSRTSELPGARGVDMNKRIRVGLTCVTAALLVGAGCRQDVSSAGGEYAVHSQITATVFWVGESAGADRPDIANAKSAWDERWQEHFGGVDDPQHRVGSRPARFVPRENPFYFALPYNDFAGGVRKPAAATVVPWAGERVWGAAEPMCKNRWIRISRAGRTCYAQWEDVGPFQTDDAGYVFGLAAPRNRSNQQAGLDVSPAVRDWLSLRGMDKVDWQFVEARDVPAGPWKDVVTASQVCWR